MIKFGHWGPAVLAAVGVEATVLLRQVLVARLAGVEFLGTLLMIMLGIRFLHMATDLAADRYLITRSNEEILGALDIVHGYSILRSLLCAVLLAFFLSLLPAGPSAYAVSAFVLTCLLKGVTHQGFRLEQRQMNFRALLRIELMPACVGLVALWPLLSVLQTLDAVATAFLIQQSLETLQSWRVRSGLPFSPALSGSVRLSFLSFGMPLLITSLVLFFSMQGERMVLALHVPLETFTPLAATIQLALLPALLLGRVMLTVLLPWMRQLTDRELKEATTKLALVILVLGVPLAGLFSTVANWCMSLLYGTQMTVAPLLLSLIALTQVGRLLRTPDSLAAQAVGLTRIPLYGNLTRAAAVPIMSLILIAGAPLWTAFASVFTAEIVAFCVQRVALRSAMTVTIQNLKNANTNADANRRMSQKEVLV